MYRGRLSEHDKNLDQTRDSPMPPEILKTRAMCCKSKSNHTLVSSRKKSESYLELRKTIDKYSRTIRIRWMISRKSKLESMKSKSITWAQILKACKMVCKKESSHTTTLYLRTIHSRMKSINCARIRKIKKKHSGCWMTK